MTALKTKKESQPGLRKEDLQALRLVSRRQTAVPDGGGGIKGRLGNDWKA